MMKTLKCQVKLSEMVWDGWKYVLPILHQLLYYLYYTILDYVNYMFMDSNTVFAVGRSTEGRAAEAFPE